MGALFSEINRIHPFREGNGRTQRQFVRQLAQSVGYKLHFEAVTKERLVLASISSAHGDLSMMQRMMDEITDTERIQAAKKLIAFFEAQKFNWNDFYLATTTPGHKYDGTFAASAGPDFYFRTDQNQIIVGKVRDLPSDVRENDRISFTAS